MSIVFVGLLGVASYLIIRETAAFIVYSGRKSIKPKFDAGRVRELEMDIWGYHWTQLPEAKAKPVATGTRNCATQKCPNETTDTLFCAKCRMSGKDKLPKAKAGAGILYPEAKTCYQCAEPIESYGTECFPCEKDRHNYIKKNKQPRQKIVKHDGLNYRVLLPTEVPDNVFVEISEYDYRGSLRTRPFAHAYLKWTDSKTGAQKGLRASAVEVEGFEIHSDQYEAPVHIESIDYNMAVKIYEANSRAPRIKMETVRK